MLAILSGGEGKEKSMARQRKTPPGVDPKLLIKDAAKLLPEPSRRLFLRGAASLGALAVLSGCDIVDGETSENALRVISTFNDRVQALLFNPNTLAPEYPASMITRPFPFNGYYSEDEAPDIDGEQYQLEIGGLVEKRSPGRFPSSTSYRRCRRSRGSFASKAGALSAPGRARSCPIS